MEDKKTTKRRLEKTIGELEEKLARLSAKLESDLEKRKIPAKNSPIGYDNDNVLQEVLDAKNSSVKRAGLVKTTQEGSIFDEEDNKKIDIIPDERIHTFDDLDVCICNCHNFDKIDCMNCYDHPTHLDPKRKQVEEEYSTEKIMELIDEDKSKQEKKKHWWQH